MCRFYTETVINAILTGLCEEIMKELDKNPETTLEFAREAHERWLIKNNKNDLDKAIEYYSKTLSANPNIPESYYRLALLLWESGQISLTTAIDKCRLALTVCPKNVNARLYTGYFLKLAEKYDEAEKEFKTAVNIAPLSSSRARLNLGLLNFEKLLNREISVPTVAKSLYYLASGALIGAFDYPCIRMSIQKVRERFRVGKYLFTANVLKAFGLAKNALSIYKRACKKTGRYEIFNKLIGDIAVEGENVSAALASYERVLLVNPNDREALLKKATILQTYFPERSDEAIQAYTRALNTDGERDYIYYELGHLYLKNKDMINSVNAFKLAVEEDKMNPYFHNALGFALFSTGQYDDAEDHYLVAINLNPEPEWTATVCRAVALIYSDVQKKPEKAKRMYLQSLSLFADCADTYASLGDIYFDEEDYDKAVEYYSKAIELNTTDGYVYNKFATALWQKDFIEEAIIAFKNAIKAAPDYAPVYNNLGAVYLDGKQMYHQAKDCFEKAVELDETYAMAYFNAGRAYEMLNDKVSAAKYYGKALELNKVKKEIKDIDIEEIIRSLFEV